MKLLCTISDLLDLTGQLGMCFFVNSASRESSGSRTVDKFSNIWPDDQCTIRAVDVLSNSFLTKAQGVIIPNSPQILPYKDPYVPRPPRQSLVGPRQAHSGGPRPINLCAGCTEDGSVSVAWPTRDWLGGRGTRGALLRKHYGGRFLYFVRSVRSY